MTSQHHPATPENNKDLEDTRLHEQHAASTPKPPDDGHATDVATIWATAIKPRLRQAVRPVTLARPDDIRLSAMLAAVVAGTIALVARLGRLSRDVDAHTREHVKLWAETDDVRTKLVDIGEDLAQALSSPPGGDQR
jgi:hypothetical protein